MFGPTEVLPTDDTDYADGDLELVIRRFDRTAGICLSEILRASEVNETGANLRVQAYTANNLNHYSQRTVPGYVDVFGTATNASTVTVNQQSTYRHGEYYRAELSVNNSSAALWVGVTNVAVITNSGPDIVTSNLGNVYKPKTPEVFGHDADGNLTNDGRYAYTWDAENRLVTMTSPSAIPTGGRKALAFTYDFQGRRVSKKVSNWTGSAWSLVLQRKFVHDEWNLIAVLDKLQRNGPPVQVGLRPERNATRRRRRGRVGEGLRSEFRSTFLPWLRRQWERDGLGRRLERSIQANYEYGPFGELLRITGIWAKETVTLAGQ